ncbi:MAG: hypothetical protein M3268_08085 [Acidobacteriota bacterium]|nr:hypothetical protein [Acidobacteriota bacterium]
MAKRYKIRAPDPQRYEEVRRLVESRVPVLVESEKRRMLSTGELPPDLVEEVKRRGCEVVPDVQYEAD